MKFFDLPKCTDFMDQNLRKFVTKQYCDLCKIWHLDKNMSCSSQALKDKLGIESSTLTHDELLNMANDKHQEIQTCYESFKKVCDYLEGNREVFVSSV